MAADFWHANKVVHAAQARYLHVLLILAVSLSGILPYIIRSRKYANLHRYAIECVSPRMENIRMTSISSSFSRPVGENRPYGSIEEQKQVGPADEAVASKQTFMALINAVRVFELSLDHMHEIGAYFVSDAGGRTFHVRRISQSGSLLIFEGMFDGHPIHLVKHYTQVNIALTALPKISREPVRIGFVLND